MAAAEQKINGSVYFHSGQAWERIFEGNSGEAEYFAGVAQNLRPKEADRGKRTALMASLRGFVADALQNGQERGDQKIKFVPNGVRPMIAENKQAQDLILGAQAVPEAQVAVIAADNLLTVALTYFVTNTGVSLNSVRADMKAYIANNRDTQRNIVLHILLGMGATMNSKSNLNENLSTQIAALGKVGPSFSGNGGNFRGFTILGYDVHKCIIEALRLDPELAIAPWAVQMHNAFKRFVPSGDIRQMAPPSAGSDPSDRESIMWQTKNLFEGWVYDIMYLPFITTTRITMGAAANVASFKAIEPFKKEEGKQKPDARGRGRRN